MQDNANNQEKNPSKPEVKEKTNAEQELESKLLKIIKNSKEINEELQAKTKKEKTEADVKNEPKNKENRLEQDKERQYAEVKLLLEAARGASIAGNYDTCS